MITIKHLDATATRQVQRDLEHWNESIKIIYDELADLYDIEIGDDVPIFVKYWSGVDDPTVYVHIGSKILGVAGEMTIT